MIYFSSYIINDIYKNDIIAAFNNYYNRLIEISPCV